MSTVVKKKTLKSYPDIISLFYRFSKNNINNNETVNFILYSSSIRKTVLCDKIINELSTDIELLNSLMKIINNKVKKKTKGLDKEVAKQETKEINKLKAERKLQLNELLYPCLDKYKDDLIEYYKSLYNVNKESKDNESNVEEEEPSVDIEDKKPSVECETDESSVNREDKKPSVESDDEQVSPVKEVNVDKKKAVKKNTTSNPTKKHNLRNKK